MPDTDTTVRCLTCGQVHQVNFAHCLGHGWDLCCGPVRISYTSADIKAAFWSTVSKDKTNIRFSLPSSAISPHKLQSLISSWGALPFCPANYHCPDMSQNPTHCPNFSTCFELGQQLGISSSISIV
jgi:hypothetical protein